MTKQCICQICTCGRHRCPHYPQGRTGPQEPCTLSEYTTRYVQHPTEPRKDYRPQDKPISSDAALDDKTTHRVDYVPHPLGERYVRQGEEYRPPQGELDTMTNYNKDFTAKQGDPAKPIRQQEGPKVLGKFEGEPTYQADYKRWDPQQRGLIKPDQGYVPNSAPFDGNTHYQTDFVPKNGGPRESMRPQEAALRSDQPFQDATETKDRYIRHPLQAREARKEAPYEPNTAPLDDLTTHRKDFTPKEIGKNLNYKPDQNPYQSSAPFDENTTHKTDYVPWQVEKPHAREADVYQKPQGEMDMNTTTHTDYTRKPLERQLARRPQEAPLSTGKFDDSTNYKTDYQKWGPGERAAMPQQPTYRPNDAPFEGLATYQRDYIARKGDPARSIRPLDTTYRSNAPFDDATEYNNEFVKKWVAPCPVPLIEGGHDIGYTYRDQDNGGHKWYDFVANEAFEKYKSGRMYGQLVK